MPRRTEKAALPTPPSDSPPYYSLMDPEALPDRDLYCVSCGYNLRGLTGDPICCPECGFSNAVAIMEIPAGDIRRQLKQMESAAAYSLLALGVLLVSLPVSWASLRFRGAVGPHAAALIGAALLAICLHYVRKSCGGSRGWLLALLMYWTCGVSMLAGAIALMVLAIWQTVEITSGLRMSDNWNTIVLIVVIVLTLALPVHLWVRVTYRLATWRLHALQRMVAVEVAEKEVRRKIGMATRPHES